MKWYEKYAASKGYTINKEVEDVVVQGLEANKERYGVRHCPCRMPATYSPDTICPCKELRETRHCHCMLFADSQTEASEQ